MDSLNQEAACIGRYLLKGGVTVTAQHDVLSGKARADARHGDGSTSVNGQPQRISAFD